MKKRTLRFLSGLSIASSLMFILSNIISINDIYKSNIPDKISLYIQAVIYLLLLIGNLIVAFQLWERVRSKRWE